MNSMATLSAKSMDQFQKLSYQDRRLVTNLIDNLATKEEKRRKHFSLIGLLGIMLINITSSQNPTTELTDEEIDAIIASERAKHSATTGN